MLQALVSDLKIQRAGWLCGEGHGAWRRGGGRWRGSGSPCENRREISLCAGRPFQRSERARKNRPAPFEMTVGAVVHRLPVRLK